MRMKVCQVWINLIWTHIWKSKICLLNTIQIWIFCNIGRIIDLAFRCIPKDVMESELHDVMLVCQMYFISSVVNVVDCILFVTDV